MIDFTLKPIYSFSIFTGLVHKSSWWSLRQESCALRARGLAHGSWANRISHLKAYIAFTIYYGIQDFPLLLGVLLRFIALLARGPYAFGSAANILSSLRWFTKILDPSSDKLFETVLVTISMKGLKAQLSRPRRQKLPLCVDHLAKFYEILDFSNVKQLACWCAMLLAFFGCFRLSNLVPSSKNNFDPLKHLKRNDIVLNKDFVLVYYKWSKTNQNSSKVSWIPICPVSDVRFNLKKYLKLLFSVVKVSENAPLFTYSKKEFHSRCSLVRLLNQCLSGAGLSSSDYSWHSFRRGAAVFAFELGLADSAVQLLGDWSSSAFKTYLEFAFKKKAAVAKDIAKSFDLCAKNL